VQAVCVGTMSKLQRSALATDRFSKQSDGPLGLLSSRVLPEHESGLGPPDAASNRAADVTGADLVGGKWECEQDGRVLLPHGRKATP
jgi:hypothetical protein